MKTYTLEGQSNAHSCFCIGPQNGEPLCPCRMRDVIIRNGRYIMPERDLGPVSARAAFEASKVKAPEG